MIRCMKRTNIYLDEKQVMALDELARARGVSRAELIRRLLEAALDGATDDGVSEDVAAIEKSFGALAGVSDFISRGSDERFRHLDHIGNG